MIHDLQKCGNLILLLHAVLMINLSDDS